MSTLELLHMLERHELALREMAAEHNIAEKEFSHSFPSHEYALISTADSLKSSRERLTEIARILYDKR